MNASVRGSSWLLALACFSTAPWEAAVDISIPVTVFVDGDFEFETYDGLHDPDDWSYIFGADILPTGTVRMGETTWTIEVLFRFVVFLLGRVIFVFVSLARICLRAREK